jgi:hypothetical protein
MSESKAAASATSGWLRGNGMVARFHVAASLAAAAWAPIRLHYTAFFGLFIRFLPETHRLPRGASGSGPNGRWVSRTRTPIAAENGRFAGISLYFPQPRREIVSQRFLANSGKSSRFAGSSSSREVPRSVSLLPVIRARIYLRHFDPRSGRQSSRHSRNVLWKRSTDLSFKTCIWQRRRRSTGSK